MTRTIRYSISKDGQITLDFHGFRGKACLDEVEKILKALRDNFGINVDIESRELKTEFYQEQQEVVEQ